MGAVIIGSEGLVGACGAVTAPTSIVITSEAADDVLFVTLTVAVAAVATIAGRVTVISPVVLFESHDGVFPRLKL